MPRISGIDIPADKPIWISLTYIFGVGRTNSKQILKEAGIEFQRRAKELNEDELAKIIGIIDRGVLVEGALRRQINQNVQRLKDIGSYGATAIAAACLCADKRTRSNARVRKGPRKTVAGKKGVKELGK